MPESELVDGEAENPVVRHQARPIESRFLYVDVAAARAKQLRKGAKVRLDAGAPRAVKPERLAMEEVNQQLVEWDLPEFAVLVEKR
ncbi:MAG: DNA-directed RNA polymerase subunit omega [Acidobacteria bacterium]|nr:DNA-directed RNA polymerase subunit omega [Acidobacteriota bacterium]